MISQDELFYVCDAAVSWVEAKEVCEALCGRLVVAKSPPRQDQLQQMLFDRLTPEQQELGFLNEQPSYPDASSWVGACRDGADFRWVDNTLMPSKKGQDGWGSSDPDGDDGDCVVIGIYAKGEENGSWFDRPPGDPYIFTCEALP